jgi:hypothetical protein
MLAKQTQHLVRTLKIQLLSNEILTRSRDAGSKLAM